MFDLLFLVAVLPLAGFLVLALIGPRLSARGVAAVGVGSVGLSAVVALAVAAAFLLSPPPGYAFTQTLWTWMRIGQDFAPTIAFRLDALSLVMMLVVTFVGFLIHLYSTQYMAGEEGYSRFFAYMNLFVGSMLALVLADNILLLFLGWEAVGLCSYLLIGFWHREPSNVRAARKAFVVTRVGDTAFIVGIFLLFTSLGALDIQELMRRASLQWPQGHYLAAAASALLLGGAIGKSAQLPLQTWLPDAMAGPTPVSALIHAATMVTAGVYLIARTNVLFSLAPSVMLTVAVIGAATLLYGGFSALVQTDIKRALAYSTISQIGLMFLALGVGAWDAAIFQFMTHAFFKALLFMGAGVVILALHHEQNLFRMGGLRHQLPFTYWTFLAGAASLSGFPIITAGFYSKDLILFQAWFSQRGSPWLWAAGLLSAFLTAVYAFRLLFLVFHGEMRQQPTWRPGLQMQAPLAILAFLAITAGFLEIPYTQVDVAFFSSFLGHTLPAAPLAQADPALEAGLTGAAVLLTLAGIYVAYLFFLRAPALAARMAATPWGSALHRWWLAGWGFDWLYDWVFVRPVVWLAEISREDVLDLLYQAVALASRTAWSLVSFTQSGRLRWYAMGIALGAALLIGIGAFR